MNFSKLVLLFTLLILVVFSVGCATLNAEINSPADNGVEVPQLDDAVWQLIDLNGKTVSAQITLTFAVSELQGSAGCNSYFGQYQLNGNQLTIKGLGNTEMYCDETTMQEEFEFLQALGSTQSLERVDNQLIITTNKGNLVFEPILPISDVSLENTTWQLTMFEDAEVVSSLLADTVITLEFTENEVNGNSGCNSYFGTYQLTDGGLSIGKLGSTRMFCGDEVMQQEAEYLQALEAAQLVMIEGNILRITHTNGMFVFRGE